MSIKRTIMPKGKELSVAEKKIMIYLYEQGHSIAYICDMFERSHSTISSAINRLIKRKSLENMPRSGRPKMLSTREERKILQENRNNPHLSAPKINNILRTSYNTIVSDETVRRVLRDNDIHGRVARKKPYISPTNVLKRLTFANTYKMKDFDFWEKVIFSDESKYNIFGSDGRQMVWRKPCKALDLKNIKPTVKHGGASVMVWGCMSARGVGNLIFIDTTMTADVYLDILKQNLHSSATKMGFEGNQFMFQHDNDPKHTAWRVKMWILYNAKHLETPPQSPDTNPIEHLWSYLESKIRQHHITSITTLKNVLMEEWEKITPELCRKLVESMPRRLEAIYVNKGHNTKY